MLSNAMSPSLDKYLCEKYPDLFSERHKSMQETCMCWGFEHGDGWFHLLDITCGAIQNHVNNPQWVPKTGFLWSLKRLWNNTAWNWVLYPILHRVLKFDTYCKFCQCLSFRLEYDEPPKRQAVAAQVKEKFGGLRFYIHNGDDEIYSMTNMVEYISFHICEECGKMDESVVCMGKGWIRTLCYGCRSILRPDEKEDHMKILEDSKLNSKKAIALAEARVYKKEQNK